MKVLLVQPPHYYGPYSRPPEFFNLGAGYIAKSLAKAGHTIEVFDIYANQYNTTEEIEEKINELSSDFDIICISALTTQYKYVKWFIGKLKEKFDKPIIVGNALATFSAEALLKHSKVDICVLGEGEETIVDLLVNLDSLDKVQGICYSDNGNILYTPARPYIRDLDTIDFPLRDIFPIDIYLRHSCLWSNPEIKAINVITARGCPYKCNFCSKTFGGIRLRSIENIIQEIEELKTKYDFRGIDFNDELTLINKVRMYELCKYLKKSKLSWVCQGRVNLVDMDLLKCMKDSGCKALGFGVESGSQKILDNMNKGITVDQAIKAIEASKKVGIEPIIQMMYGYPGEDDETLNQTVSFFKKIKSPTMPFSMTTALPGTELYTTVYGNGLIKDEDRYLEKLDWGYYADREILINFTDFSIDELIRKRREIEAEINRNYQRYLFIHPWAICKILFKKVRSYYLRYGLLKTLRKMMQFRSYSKKDSLML